MAYLDPNMSGTTQQAKDYFNQEAIKRRGTGLSESEFNTLGQQVGVTGNTVTGQQYNQALNTMGWGDQATQADSTGVTATGTTTNTGGTTDPNFNQTGTTDQRGTTTGTTGTTDQTAATGQQADTSGITAQTAGTTTTGTTAQTGTAGVDANTALQKVQQTFSTKFGRAMTGDEQQLAINVAKQNGWSGTGPVPQAALDAVLKAVDTYNAGGGTGGGGTGGGGTGGGGTGETGGTGTGQIDPTVAQKQVNDAFLKKFGKSMTSEEMQWLYKMAGYTPGQPVTQDMLDKATDAINRYTGNLQQPFNPSEEEDATETAAKDRLKELLKLSYGEVDPHSAAMTQQRQQFQRGTERSRARAQAAGAERAAYKGLQGTGGYDVMQDALQQQAGEANAGFEANLMATELKDQRANLQEAIKLATSLGQQDKARALQDKLGMLELDLRKYLGKGQLGLGLLNSNRGDQQFYEGLGLDYAKLMAQMNKDAIMGMF